MSRFARWFVLPLMQPPERPWWREDRGYFSRFMDFYCERLYPLMIAFILGFVVIVVAHGRS